MNILTFDIEEWYIEKKFHGARTERYAKFDDLLDNILDLLDEANTKATFFCLGELVNGFSYVVKKIEKRGHDIGCHSNKHSWLNKLSHKEVMQDTSAAINNLEQCIGQKVISYRAPAFSIGENNKWAFEALVNCGIKIDSSVFPAVRDFGGFSSFQCKEPCLLNYNEYTIKEFPISTINLFGNDIVFSGGGYFRLFPLSFVKKNLKLQHYSMSYFHIGDLISENNKMLTKEEYERYFKEKGTLFNRYKRCGKSNLGTKGAFNKLSSLIRSENFISLNQADKMINWNEAQNIKLD
jgi:polysaccharide deacetylase family protein (PEP-CTERM system associated)